jgi:hypothetical protein
MESKKEKTQAGQAFQVFRFSDHDSCHFPLCFQSQSSLLSGLSEIALSNA